MKKERIDAWTEEEIAILREKYPTQGNMIPELLDKRSRLSLDTRARMIGVYRINKGDRYEGTIKKKVIKFENVNYVGLFTDHIKGSLEKDIIEQHITLVYKPSQEQFA